MKTKFIAAVIATCFAAPVMAQSSVTIYGIADAGLMKASGQTLRVVSGIADGSRIGFKGSEDIGGGFKAIFNLEARVELDNGSQQPTLLSPEQGLYLTKGMGALPAPLLAGLRAGFQPRIAVNPENALFDRTSMVGLITPGGAVLLGRMYTPGYEVFAATDAFESGTAGTWGHIIGGTAGFTNLGVDIRSSKSIQYRIATPAGFGGSLMYGTKGAGYLNRYNKFLGAAATYKANGWDLGIAQNRGYDQGDAVSLVSSIAGGSSAMGDAKLFAGVLHQRNRNSVLLREYQAGFEANIAALPAPTQAALRGIFTPNIIANTQLDATAYQIGAQYRVGAGRVMVSIAHQDDRTPSNSDATQVAFGYDYNLSKRTDIYTVVAQIDNQNDGQYIPGAAGSPGGFSKVPGETTRAYQIGIRHRF
jgi:predicted porin